MNCAVVSFLTARCAASRNAHGTDSSGTTDECTVQEMWPRSLTRAGFSCADQRFSRQVFTIIFSHEISRYRVASVVPMWLFRGGALPCSKCHSHRISENRAVVERAGVQYRS